MIVSFGDRATEDLFHGIRSNRVRRFPPNVAKTALQKLDVINAAHSLDDLRIPPGNRLEALSGDLQDFYSIRVNNQWRIIFRWRQPHAFDVKIVDYH